MPNNDYLNALSAYDQTTKRSITDPREVEVRALLKAAEQLQSLRDNWNPRDIEGQESILSRNEKLWTIFAEEMQKEDTGLDMAIRNNIANLGVYVFKRSMQIRAEPSPEKLDVLININRNIAAGLQDSIEYTKKQLAAERAKAAGSSQDNSGRSDKASAHNPYGTGSSSESTDFDI